MRLPLKWARIGFVLIVACLGTMLLSFFAPTLRLLFLGFGLALVLRSEERRVGKECL